MVSVEREYWLNHNGRLHGGDEAVNGPVRTKADQVGGPGGEGVVSVDVWTV